MAGRHMSLDFLFQTCRKSSPNLERVLGSSESRPNGTAVALMSKGI